MRGTAARDQAIARQIEPAPLRPFLQRRLGVARRRRGGVDQGGELLDDEAAPFAARNLGPCSELFPELRTAALLLELGPVLAGLMVAGRVGAAMAAAEMEAAKAI